MLFTSSTHVLRHTTLLRGIPLIIIGSSLTLGLYAQYAGKPSKAGDLIESTSYNDHKRGQPRQLQYLPDGQDFVSLNGENRYTRALYGSHTEWRLETSDRPIFAVYVKNDSRNIRFSLRLPDGTLTPLESTTQCEARYTPGRRSYVLTDEAWGADARLRIAVLASPDDEQALWQFVGEGLPEGTQIEAITAPIRQSQLQRAGDMGADPPLSFDPSPDTSTWQTLTTALPSGSTCYASVVGNVVGFEGNDDLFASYEEARAHLAGRIVVDTPDPYLNTIGGVLATAADGVWGEEGVWLHGAVGWRMPLSGWRAAYTGDVLGWHDRARTHFDNYALSQVTDIPNTIPHPAQDSTLALARSAKIWGTPQYSNGYICRNPRRNNQMHHYDMNLCYMDELVRHLNWTGDTAYAKRMWPVIERHLAWERLNYDPDDDGLYDAYACIWASDALFYNSGAVTHSSAYNCYANRAAARIASLIGQDPEPYQREAERIQDGINHRLWLADEGHWAEYQDYMGHKRTHTHAGVWTIYHAIDSRVGNPYQSYLATRYVDNRIPHIPVVVDEASAIDEMHRSEASLINAQDYATIATTDWLPYSWSINNVAFAEVMHTALAYFQAGRPSAGVKLMKSSLLDGMYLGESPGNVGQISFYDAARGECYRDFGDPIGVASRLLVEGLYGISPDALSGQLTIRPGFPSDWDHASLHTPDIDFSFQTDSLARQSTYDIAHRLPTVGRVDLIIEARSSEVNRLTVNGEPADWTPVADAIDSPLIAISLDARAGDSVLVCIHWGGEPIDLVSLPTRQDAQEVHHEGAARFVSVSQGQMKWWVLTDDPTLTDPMTDFNPKAWGLSDFDGVVGSECKPIDISTAFNAQVTDIFRNQYLSPRSPYTTLQLPVQGIGEWCHPLATAEIDDTGLRNAIHEGQIQAMGIPFLSPKEGNNIAFASLWDNYADSITVKLSGKASHAYLLMAGSTNHMQCHIPNATVKAYYKDGSCDVLTLQNPINWAPIEQVFFEDGLAFHRHAPALYRLWLKTGEVSNSFGTDLGFTGVPRMMDGGAATLLDMPINPDKKLSHLTVEALSNDVVIGLMAVTLRK